MLGKEEKLSVGSRAYWFVPNMFFFCHMREATAHLPYCSGGAEQSEPTAASSPPLSLSFRGAETEAAFQFHAISLPVRWNLRARGCAWDMGTHRGGNNLEARTPGRKYIQILHFRRGKNILIHKCCFYS